MKGNLHSLRNRQRGFTLVELLVVIAIIGVLVALLLPAVQAAREAARRTQCVNNVKQVMLSMHNHVSARNAFPSGGVAPWPHIEDFLTDSKPGVANVGTSGAPLGPERQGLSWAFQLLPYLEGGAIHNIKTDAALTQTDVPMYHCPSRRPPTRAGGVGPYLMDYAAAVPLLMPQEWSSSGEGRYTNALNAHPSWGIIGCQYMQMWNGQLALGPRFQVPPADGQPTLDQETPSGSTTAAGMTAKNNYAPNMGVIIRSDYCALCPIGKNQTGFYTRINFEHIADGSSNTLVISEKKLEPQNYYIGVGHDDRGWSDGWDFDTIRMSICPPGPDENSPTFANALPYSFGSAHPVGINAGFADASVRQLSYEINIEVLNFLAHRNDGRTVDSESF